MHIIKDLLNVSILFKHLSDINSGMFQVDHL